MLLTAAVLPQAVPYARSFQKSAEEIEGALKDLQAYSGQKLPIVDGFVATGDKSLNQYERAFYQFSIDLLSGTSKESDVHTQMVEDMIRLFEAQRPEAPGEIMPDE